MKLGGFGLVSDYEKISTAGYDFAELDMPEIERLSEEEFKHFSDTVEKIGLPVLTGARVIPITTPLFFIDGFAPMELKEYLTTTCKRASELGIKKVILGNGKARSLLSDEDIKKEKIFIDFLRMLADIAGNNNQELILEPLGPKYSNYINTIPEAVRVINEVNMPNMFTMADLRHLVWSKEPFENLIVYADYIHHIHIDYPLSYPERDYPRADDDFDYSGFLKVLNKSKYNDTLTIEADIPKNWNNSHKQVMKILGDIMSMHKEGMQ